MRKLLFLALLPLLLSCGGDDEATTEPRMTNQQLIIGRWGLSEYATSNDYTKFMDAQVKDTITFTSTSYTQKYPDYTTSGSYTVDDTYLTLKEMWTYRINFDGTDIMYLREYGFGDANSVYKYRRLK